MDADMVDETGGESSAGDTDDETMDPATSGLSESERAEIDVEALIAERDSMRETAQRVQADFENYRKRVASQTADDIDRATGRIADSLLSVLDACEAAFVTHPTQIEPLFNLLLSELKKQGLEVMNLQGQPFDPTMAEAVMHEAGDGDSDGSSVVVEVMRTGYVWKNKVLRAALVKVRG